MSQDVTGQIPAPRPHNARARENGQDTRDAHVRVPHPTPAIWDLADHTKRGTPAFIEPGDPLPVPAVIPAPDDPDQLDFGIDAQIGAVVERDPRWDQVLDSEEFDRRALDLHADGLSLQEIADTLAAEGVLTWHQGDFLPPGKQKVWRAVQRATKTLVAETLASESDKAVQVLRANRRVARTTKRLRSLMQMREEALAATDKHGEPKPNVNQVLSIDFAITAAEKMLTEADTMLTTLTGHMVQRTEAKVTVEGTVNVAPALGPALAALKALNAAEMLADERMALERYERDTAMPVLEGEVIEVEVIEGRGP